MTEQLTIDFKPLADALVIFRKTLVDGGIEESHALMMTRDVLGKYDPTPPRWNVSRFKPLDSFPQVRPL